MACYRKGIEFGEDSDATENALAENSEQLKKSTYTDSFYIDPPFKGGDGGENGCQCNCEKEKGKETIAEFDPRMERSLRLMGNWGVRATGAGGPGGTAQA